MRRSGYLSNRVVDVVTERLPILITIEEWGENFQRQRRRHEERTFFERGDDCVAESFRVLVILGQLQIIFRARGLMARGYAAIYPLRAVEQFATTRNLFRSQNVWNL